MLKVIHKMSLLRICYLHPLIAATVHASICKSFPGETPLRFRDVKMCASMKDPPTIGLESAWNTLALTQSVMLDVPVLCRHVSVSIAELKFAYRSQSSCTSQGRAH